MDIKKIKCGDIVSFRSVSNSAIFYGRVCEIDRDKIDGVETIKFFVYVHLSGNVYAVPSKNIVS